MSKSDRNAMPRGGGAKAAVKDGKIAVPLPSPVSQPATSNLTSAPASGYTQEHGGVVPGRQNSSSFLESAIPPSQEASTAPTTSDSMASTVPLIYGYEPQKKNLVRTVTLSRLFRWWLGTSLDPDVGRWSLNNHQRRLPIVSKKLVAFVRITVNSLVANTLMQSKSTETRGTRTILSQQILIGRPPVQLEKKKQAYTDRLGSFGLLLCRLVSRARVSRRCLVSVIT